MSRGEEEREPLFDTPRMLLKLENPYLERFMKENSGRKNGPWQLQWDAASRAFFARDRMVKEFSWAVPSNEAIYKIAGYSPLIEIGAGTGYWASLLQQVGADVVAYDESPPDGTTDNFYHDGTITYTKVLKGTPTKIKEHKDRNLFLCWPPYSESMAADCLKLFKGKYLIYVGEGYGGCTGDDEFHEMIKKDFEEVETINIPQWFGLHDYGCIYKRK